MFRTRMTSRLRYLKEVVCWRGYDIVMVLLHLFGHETKKHSLGRGLAHDWSYERDAIVNDRT